MTKTYRIVVPFDTAEIEPLGAALSEAGTPGVVREAARSLAALLVDEATGYGTVTVPATEATGYVTVAILATVDVKAD